MPEKNKETGIQTMPVSSAWRKLLLFVVAGLTDIVCPAGVVCRGGLQAADRVVTGEAVISPRHGMRNLGSLLPLCCGGCRRLWFPHDRR